MAEKFKQVHVDFPEVDMSRNLAVKMELPKPVLKAELVDVLQVAIARGEKLGYQDDDYRARLVELTGKSFEETNP